MIKFNLSLIGISILVVATITICPVHLCREATVLSPQDKSIREELNRVETTIQQEVKQYQTQHIHHDEVYCKWGYDSILSYLIILFIILYFIL